MYWPHWPHCPAAQHEPQHWGLCQLPKATRAQPQNTTTSIDKVMDTHGEPGHTHEVRAEHTENPGCPCFWTLHRTEAEPSIVCPSVLKLGQGAVRTRPVAQGVTSCGQHGLMTLGDHGLPSIPSIWEMPAAPSGRSRRGARAASMPTGGGVSQQ